MENNKPFRFYDFERIRMDLDNLSLDARKTYLGNLKFSKHSVLSLTQALERRKTFENIYLIEGQYVCSQSHNDLPVQARQVYTAPEVHVTK